MAVVVPDEEVVKPFAENNGLPTDMAKFCQSQACYYDIKIRQRCWCGWFFFEHLIANLPHEGGIAEIGRESLKDKALYPCNHYHIDLDQPSYIHCLMSVHLSLSRHSCLFLYLHACQSTFLYVCWLFFAFVSVDISSFSTLLSVSVFLSISLSVTLFFSLHHLFSHLSLPPSPCLTNFEHVECSLPCLGFQAAKDIILKDMIEVGKANGLRGFEQVRMLVVSRRRNFTFCAFV